jgi:hypothetical protein
VCKAGGAVGAGQYIADQRRGVPDDKDSKAGLLGDDFADLLTQLGWPSMLLSGSDLRCAGACMSIVLCIVTVSSVAFREVVAKSDRTMPHVTLPASGVAACCRCTKCHQSLTYAVRFLYVEGVVRMLYAGCYLASTLHITLFVRRRTPPNLEKKQSLLHCNTCASQQVRH